MEIGTGLGYSTLALADTAEQVWTIDIDPWVIGNVHPRLLKLPNVGTLTDRPLTFMAGVSVVFIDGDHTYESTLEDIQYARKILSGPQVIVLHDCYMDDVKRAIKDAGLFGEIYPTPCQIGKFQV